MRDLSEGKCPCSFCLQLCQHHEQCMICFHGMPADRSTENFIRTDTHWSPIRSCHFILRCSFTPAGGLRERSVIRTGLVPGRLLRDNGHPRKELGHLCQCSGAVLDVRMLQQIRSLRALLRILPETGHDEIFAVVRGPSREVEFLLFGDLDQQLDESCSAAAERIVTQKTFCENQTSSPDVTLYTVFFTLDPLWAHVRCGTNES
mmetsp:Transcript_4470/g.8245  ORF Transcript_4470/g.8245 Transcript_4470/m.8245 type:complete len:204 (+) Transcript_4470:1909-2520(+)